MRIVCGLDVHKDSIFLCIMSSTGEILEKKYGVLTNQLEEMRDLMLTYHVQEVGMESTSVYWGSCMAHTGTSFQAETYQSLFHQAASRSQERRERCTVDSRVHDEGTGARQFRSP